MNFGSEAFGAILSWTLTSAIDLLILGRFQELRDAISTLESTANRIALDCELSDTLGGKSAHDHELKKCKARIAELEFEMQELRKNNEYLNSFLPSSPPLAASSPSCSQKESSSDSSNTSSCCSSVIEETLSSPLGPMLKKRKVASECRKVSAEVDGVLAKYHETLSCILGNSFLYGTDEEKGKVSEMISEVVNLVMDARGAKKGVTELLLPPTYQRLLESMRVPDWVLLYFKLQARLPDAAWQTLLNLTQLGRSGKKKQCKQWGFLLKKLFGMHLGTGYYGHLVIDHSSMLLRHFRSLHKYCGQGFEASHKLHRNLYSKATNHDSTAPGQSLDHILTHWFSTMLLSLRYAFREAKNCIVFGKKKFSFRGCGWKAIDTRNWSREHRNWIFVIDNLFTQPFGEDFLRYVYDKDKGTSVDKQILSTLIDYSHDQWQSTYLKQQAAAEKDAPAKGFIPKHRTLMNTFPSPKKMILGSETSQDRVIVLGEDGIEVANGPSNGYQQQLSSTKSAASILVEDDDTGQANSPRDGIQEQLSYAIFTVTTRGQLASLASLIPPVSSPGGSLSLLLGHVTDSGSAFTDPFTVGQRPCQAVIERAETLLSNERKKGNNPCGVVIPGLGQFSEQSLRILKRFCAISEAKHKVTAEATWLAEVDCTQRELELLQSVLWNRPATSSLLACDHKAIDVLSFSELAEERYIDSFVIDVCISKYIEEYYLQGKKDTLYLPTDFFQWMQVQDNYLTFHVHQSCAHVNDVYLRFTLRFPVDNS
ncbi:uncharacterized protein [Montipora capricornis]|uniref:uncharacterized protein n=1 Tax=Montipora capricornis TaxID=246305 RepID=UPI0035F21753